MALVRSLAILEGLLLVCGLSWSTAAQEAGTPPKKSSVPESEPTAAIRDILVAACSHDEAAFRKFLTVRNEEAYSQMTAAARTELLKRFVLMENRGTPSVSSGTNGDPSIRCQTDQGSAAITLGSANIHDNLAFVPVEIGDAADPDASHAHHIQMSLIREDGQWKILSIGLLFLDLPSLAVEWDKAEMAQNEKAALANLKALATAIETYRHKYLRLPQSLSQLRSPKEGKISESEAGLIDDDLASGLKNGYSFRYVIVGASDVGAPAKYELSATPRPYGRAGKVSFFRDSAGVYHEGDHDGAVGSELDPKAQ